MTGHGMDTREAARHLGVSERTMQRYLRAYLAGDTSRGFVATKLHTNRGKGYVWRFAFAGDATPDTPRETTPSPAVVSDALAVPDVSRATTAPLVGTLADRELAVLALRALEAMRAERDELRAVVESLRRPWWRELLDKRRGRP